MPKTIDEINKRIEEGCAVVVTAEEMVDIVKEKGVNKASKEVDVVTTGTMGAMCSSGAFLNFGHTDPPMKLNRAFLNDVEAYGGIAAVDVYIGSTQRSLKDKTYGGGHVIEDLVNGKEIYLSAEGDKTDCYPKTKLETTLTIDNLNQAILCNPRNAYQNYSVAVNSSESILYTYMGSLLPNFGNATYSSAGQLSPLLKDPFLRTIGVGTKIFLGGGTGYVIGEGTQHNTEVERINGVPVKPSGTLMVKGNLKEMKSKFLRGGYIYKYGTTLYVGIGIPIPVLDEEIAKFCAVSDSEIFSCVVDYGVQARSRPVIKKVSYSELRSGSIEINGGEVLTSSLSSYRKAREIASELKSMIIEKKFFLSNPVDKLPRSSFKPMREIKKDVFVKEIMKKAYTCTCDSTISEVSKIIVEKNINHIPVLKNGEMIGIVTSWDIAKAVAANKEHLEDFMTRNVITVDANDSIENAAKKLEENNISALPVLIEKKIVGIVTTEDISKLLKINSFRL